MINSYTRKDCSPNSSPTRSGRSNLISSPAKVCFQTLFWWIDPNIDALVSSHQPDCVMSSSTFRRLIYPWGNDWQIPFLIKNVEGKKVIIMDKPFPSKHFTVSEMNHIYYHLAHKLIAHNMAAVSMKLDSGLEENGPKFNNLTYTMWKLGDYSLLIRCVPFSTHFLTWQGNLPGAMARPKTPPKVPKKSSFLVSSEPMIPRQSEDLNPQPNLINKNEVVCIRSKIDYFYPGSSTADLNWSFSNLRRKWKRISRLVGTNDPPTKFIHDGSQNQSDCTDGLFKQISSHLSRPMLLINLPNFPSILNLHLLSCRNVFQLLHP